MAELKSTIEIDVEGIKQFQALTKRARADILAIKKALQDKGFKGNAKELQKAAVLYRREFLKAIKDIERADLSRIKKVLEAQAANIVRVSSTQKNGATPKQSADLEQLETAAAVVDSLGVDAEGTTESIDGLNEALVETGEGATEAAEGFEGVDESVQGTVQSISDLEERNKDIKEVLKNTPQEGQEGYEELSDTIRVLTAEYGENRDTILEFNRGLRQGVQETELKKDSIFELSQTVRRLTKEYSAMGQAERKSAEGLNLKKKIKETKDELNGLRSEIGDNRGFVGGYIQALNGLGAPLGKAKAGVGALSGAFKLLLANPVVAVVAALVAALTGLFRAFASTKAGAEFMERASARLGATLDVLRDLAVTVGKFLVDAFENPQESIKELGKFLINNVINRFKGLIDIIFVVGDALKALASTDMKALEDAAKDAATALTQIYSGLDENQQQKIKDGIGGVVDEIAREGDEVSRLTGLLQKLRDEQRGLSLDRAKQDTALVKARDASRDVNTPLAERIELLKDIASKENALTSIEIAAQQRKLDAIKAIAAASDTSADQLDKINSEAIKLERLKQLSATKILTLNRQLRQLEAKAAKEVSNNLKGETKLRQELLTVIFSQNAKRASAARALNIKLRKIEVDSIEDLTRRLIEEERLRAEKIRSQQIENFNKTITDQLEQLAAVKAAGEKSAKEVEIFEAKVNADIFELTELNNKLLQLQEKEHLKKMQTLRNDANAEAAKKREQGFSGEIEAADEEYLKKQAKEEEQGDLDLDASISRSKAIASAVTSAVQVSFDLIGKVQAAAAAAENKAFADSIAQRQRNIDAINEDLENATGVRKQFLERQLQIEKSAKEKLNQQAEKAARKQAETQRIIQLTQAVVNGALAVSGALAMQPFTPANYILAATAGAAVAVEVGVIASKKFADGGIVQGASHANGGVSASVKGAPNIELEGGESIMTVRATQMYKEELSQMNASAGGKKFQFGGDVTPNFEALNKVSSSDENRLLKQLSELNISVNVTEITNLQTQQAKVENQTSFN
jgi:hypothetical protein